MRSLKLVTEYLFSISHSHFHLLILYNDNFPEYIFGKYTLKPYLCTQIQNKDETFMYI